jgi:AcrR family transcriptional regulator
MSGKTASKAANHAGPPAQPSRKPDRRIRQTRDALGDALVALMQERDFSTITVQHVLDRAGVGRSTFYAHYRDKNDLWMSDVEDFLGYMSSLLKNSREASRRVAPVRELFAHVHEMRKLVAAFESSGKMQEFLELGQEYFARSIEQRLVAIAGTPAIEPARRRATAQAFAGSLLSLLRWWLHQRKADSPEEMDRLYHQMVWSGVAAQQAPIVPKKRL